jgi:AAA+ ATPase superfamily predicted ATPase
MINMLRKFVDREDELKALNERLSSDSFEFVVIYGRR